jgi:hypothetical protein
MSKKKEEKVKYQYKTRFGTTKDMVIEDCGSNHIRCSDEFGEYLTTRNHIDSGLTDPNRCAQSRLTKLFSGVKKEKE